jgi:predicted ATPase
MTERIRVKSEPAGIGSPARFQNLPPLLMPLIGREHQEREIRALLLRPEVRLLTLTGAGGIGKTRLAQKVATDLIEILTHGVCLVQLSSISDSDLVIPTIAQTLGLPDVEKGSLFGSGSHENASPFQIVAVEEEAQTHLMHHQGF